ncbi:branched-chain amino acid ABC transporter substrate-binding protein [Castellaniella sp.]|uniref:branched-chain amino acid ABC transporter substrate-binding protein n=1 Tax=Castellaniella sp. TaxID=1955812 RepID=UPI003C794176
MKKHVFFSLALVASLLPWSASQADNIRIAHIDPFSGAFANVGAVNGKHVQFGADLVNADGGVLKGTQLEVIRFDNKANAKDAVTALQDAIDQGIRIVTQATNSGIALAVEDAVMKYNRRNPDDPVLYLNYGSADPSITRDHCNFYTFRFEAHSGMKQDALTDRIASDKDIHKVYIIGQDYGHGHEVSKYTKQMLAAKRPDIEIVGDEFHPVGKVKDFTPYIAKIQASGADAVITGNFGSDLTLLVKAANDAGLKAKLFTQYAGTFGTPTAIGKGGIGRIYDAAPWHPEIAVEKHSKKAEELIATFKQKYDDDLYYYQIVVQMQMLGAAINQAGSAKPADVAQALANARFSGVTGDMFMRSTDHQLMHPLFVSVFTDKDIRYDSENTGIGWKTVSETLAKDLKDDSTCKVEQPA